MKFMKEFVSHFAARPAFSSREAELFLMNRGGSAGYHKLLLHNLLSRERIFRITKGVYTFHEDSQFVGFAFRPFYYGLEDALSIRNLWEQETNSVVITPRMMRTGVRRFEGRNYIVRRIDRRMFFGYSFVRYDDFSIPVSDVEKTIIDLLYFRIKLPNELMRSILLKSKKRVLNEYKREVPSWLSRRVDDTVEKLLL